MRWAGRRTPTKASNYARSTERVRVRRLAMSSIVAAEERKMGVNMSKVMRSPWLVSVNEEEEGEESVIRLKK